MEFLKENSVAIAFIIAFDIAAVLIVYLKSKKIGGIKKWKMKK